MKVELIGYPTEQDWLEVKRRALVTIGKKPVTPPDAEWKRKMLRARHSPIRYLSFEFYLEVPYYVSVHLARHVHAQPYVKSQRNDRQNEYDRNKAPQDTLVCMIWDVNGEEMMTIANKRLCRLADKATQAAVLSMCLQINAACPEFAPFLVPLCEYRGGNCPEMFSCGMYPEG